MADVLEAFLQFLVDLFAALSVFLGGGESDTELDLSSLLNGLFNKDGE